MADRGKMLHVDIQRRIVHLSKTLPIKAIARRLRIDRNTVRKYIRRIVVVSPHE